MEASNRIEHFVLDVSIGGSAVEQRPSCFTLATDDGFASIEARLQYPQNIEIGNPGDKVTINFFIGNEKHLLFTGEIYKVADCGAYRDLILTDGFKKLCDTFISAAYRKEKAQVILQDALDSAGIDKTSITCPSVEIARFSTEKIPADRIITQLIKALEEHGHAGLRFFFDAENKFHFGTVEDSGKNEGKAFEFVTGKNILKKGNDRIEVLPLPIRHSQKVIVDGKDRMPSRTELRLSGQYSRLTIWLKAVA